MKTHSNTRPAKYFLSLELNNKMDLTIGYTPDYDNKIVNALTAQALSLNNRVSATPVPPNLNIHSQYKLVGYVQSSMVE